MSDVERAWKMFAEEGRRYVDIAKALGITTSRVGDWLRAERQRRGVAPMTRTEAGMLRKGQRGYGKIVDYPDEPHCPRCSLRGKHECLGGASSFADHGVGAQWWV